MTLRPPVSKSGSEGAAPASPVPVWTLSQSSEFQDTAGNRFPGTASQLAWTSGRTLSTKALALNGTSGWAECPESMELDFRSGVTVSTWFCSSDTKRAQTLLAKGDSWRLQQNDQGAIEFALSGPVQQVTKTRTRPVLIATRKLSADSQWHQVTATYDGARAAIYLDGKEEAAMDATGNLSVNNVPLTIGELLIAQGTCWNGRLQDARVYGSSLTSEQVKALHQEQPK